MAGGVVVSDADGYGPKGVFHKYNLKGTLFCAVFVLGAILYGYDGTYFTGILAMDTFLKDFGTQDPSTGKYAITPSHQSLFASIVQVGEFVGSLSAGFVGDWKGRKGAMLFSCALVTIGAVLQLIVTGSIPLLVVGRLVLGMGVGVVSNCTTLYLSEIPPAAIRGSLVSSWQLFLGLGQVLGAGVAQGTKDYTSTFSYRFPIALNIGICAIIAGGLLWVPESPRWLVSKNREDDALPIIERIHAANPEHDVKRELKVMTDARDAERELYGGADKKWIDIFKGTERTKLLCAFGILVCQQISGVQFIFSYGTVFFESINVGSPFIITIITDIVEVVGVLVSFCLVNRFGRRPLLLYTTVVMAALLLVCGGLGTIPTAVRSKAANSAIAAMIIIYVFVFNLAWGPLAWVVATELSGGANRNRIMSAGTAGFWIFAWLVTFTLPYLYNSGKGSAGLGPMVGFIYGGGAVIAWLFVFFCIPETLGRSLEEINSMIELKVPTRSWTQYHNHRDGKRVAPFVAGDALIMKGPRPQFIENKDQGTRQLELTESIDSA